MVIKKILNNNVVVTTDENDNEIVVMGRGIAFKKRSGDYISKDMIDKVFKLSDSNISDKFKQLISDIPLKYIELSNEIISDAKKTLGKRLNDSIYITLTDHIYTAIQRSKEGINLKNALLWDIKRFYKDEFKIGLQALDYIEEKFEIRLTDDEAGFIALYIVNAQMDEDIKIVYEITQIMQEITNIVKYYYGITFDEESVYYYRFITHLKYFAQRFLHKELNYKEDTKLFEIIRNQYKEAYGCVKLIYLMMDDKYSYQLTEEEMLYLTMHIQSITEKSIL